MLSVIPIAHFSSKGTIRLCFTEKSPYNSGRKTRYLAYGAVCLGLGSLTIVVPQFLSGNYEYESDEGTNLRCIENTTVHVVG